MSHLYGAVAKRVSLSMDHFYDQMASLYHLIFSNWNESIERQAGQLTTIIHERGEPGRKRSSMSRVGSELRPSAWPSVASP